VLVDAVVVAGNGAGANVHASPNFCVAKVGQVIGLRPFAQPDLFRLHEISHVCPFADLAARAQMAVGAEQRTVRDVGFVENTSGPDEHVIAQDGILDDTK